MLRESIILPKTFSIWGKPLNHGYNKLFQTVLVSTKQVHNLQVPFFYNFFKANEFLTVAYLSLFTVIDEISMPTSLSIK